MEQQSSHRVPSTPCTPLNQLSPDRLNQHRIPQSPSLHSYLSENECSHHRDSMSSVVQDKVAFLNSLTGQPSPTRQPRGNTTTPNRARLERAMVGLEESKENLAKEVERLRGEVKTGIRRERMVAERIESLMEQLQHEKERRNTDKNAYVTEIKKCRKQTYQAELAQVEVREELKEARTDIKRLNTDIAHEKAEKEKARQEAFERAYAVAGMTEELEVLKEKMKAVEKQRDAALSELNATTISKNEMLPTPQAAVRNELRMPNEPEQTVEHRSKRPRQPDEDDATPRAAQKAVIRPARSGHHQIHAIAVTDDVLGPFYDEMRLMGNAMDGESLTMDEQIQVLKLELSRAQRQNDEHEDMIHFLHMQCQFKACPCRQAEANGQRFVHDYDYDVMVTQQHAAKKRRLDEDKKFNQLPPEPKEAVTAKAVEEPIAQEAVRVPLPEPQEMELELEDISPDHTSELEDITQVMVEPGTTNHQFTFSTSTSSTANFRATAPTLRQAHSASESMETDLFDISPVKQAADRPATALGVLTLQSPIRLVADSPKPSSLPQRSHTPVEDPPLTQSTTTRVALKDSPSRQNRRPQSRANVRSQSRTRSPLVTGINSSDFSKSASASPASTTFFPVTPVLKHPRSHHVLANQMPSQTDGPTTTTTTTTMVPLRGLEGDDVFSPAPASAHPSKSAGSDAHELVPGTPISREAALAQIRARRDRARSVNLKQNGGNGVKSAPASAKRGVTLRDGLGHALGLSGSERGRDISQASAPGRFA